MSAQRSLINSPISSLIKMKMVNYHTNLLITMSAIGKRYVRNKFCKILLVVLLPISVLCHAQDHI